MKFDFLDLILTPVAIKMVKDGVESKDCTDKLIEKYFADFGLEELIEDKPIEVEIDWFTIIDVVASLLVTKKTKAFFDNVKIWNFDNEIDIQITK